VDDKWREGTIKIPFSDETPARNYWRKIRAARLLALEVPSLLTDGQRQMHFGRLLQVPARLCGGNRNLNCCTPVKAYRKLYKVPVLSYKTPSQNVSRATGTVFRRYPLSKSQQPAKTAGEYISLYLESILPLTPFTV